MSKRGGFTLVELVVVVMILGILAAVAAPKLFSTSTTATDNGLKQTLAVIRDAIDLYAADHGGKLPGATDNTEATFKSELAPYLRGSFPKCTVGAKNDGVKITTMAGAIAGEGMPMKAWHYNVKDGGFIINYTGDTSDPAITYDEL